jgi:hypothetical protein
MAMIISHNGRNAVKVEKSTVEKEDFLQRYIYANPEARRTDGGRRYWIVVTKKPNPGSAAANSQGA